MARAPMNYRRRLRSRIIISFLLFGIGLTALFAGITLVMREWLEEELIESTLQTEVDKTADITRRDPVAGRRSNLQTMEGFTFGRNKFAEIPFEWQDYDTGVYDIEEMQDGELRAYKLAVNKADDLRVYLRYDITEQRRTRNVLMVMLIGAVGAFAALSLAIAFWLSARVLRPVTDLVARVSTFQRGQRPEPLAPHFAPDEVGRLASALDEYAERLTELVDRDRAFNADVSHELRTPLAIIRGATELLLTQEELPEKTRERIRRIDRAARQSTELTQALLLLSRNERQPPSEGETSDVAQVVDSVIETHRTQLGNKPVEVAVERNAAPRVAAPPAVLAVALGNLVGNAFKYTQAGKVTVRVDDDRVVVEDTGPGFKSDESDKLFQRGYRGQNTTGKGAGLGLAIVRRLCDLYGWRVSLVPRAEGGAVATLAFS
ncbi:MAG TPA: HAMP domain-containing sensor histidine kinase [Xanthomonadales bacterium]|nr:HAMP domain-containing sensor histidine kinase [Xanthomonadales bacterium]